MRDLEELIEVCDHGQPLGWACTGCRGNKSIGTGPARRSQPTSKHRRSAFLFCDHEPLYEELLKLRAAHVAGVVLPLEIDCTCQAPVRNDPAWHVPSCPWRIRQVVA